MTTSESKAVRPRPARGLVAVAIAVVAVAALALASSRSEAAGGASGGMGIVDGRAFVPGQIVLGTASQENRVVDLPEGMAVGQAVKQLASHPRVRYVQPNHIASASYVPRDSGSLRRLSPRPEPVTGDQLPGQIAPPAVGYVGGWMSHQWNFLPWRPNARLPVSPGGINALGAWRNLRLSGRGAGRGVVVAVIDTGVAYRNLGRRFRRNPDFGARQFTAGYDFVLGNRIPLDRNGHGTHVAGTIAQATDNGIGLAGIAPGARIMPVRVLDDRGNGSSDRIAEGIRWAADRGADIINMSFNFACGDAVPNVEAAVRHAFRKGVVLVGSVGNSQTEACISAPASFPQVIGVGGTTEGGCLGNYSLTGPGLDLVAPGGGFPVPGYECEIAGTRSILQPTLVRPGDTRRFGLPTRYFGTSMAAAHVSGVAALVLSWSGLGPDPRPMQVKAHLASTARSPVLMPQTVGFGAGILDAAAATSPAIIPPQKGRVRARPRR